METILCGTTARGSTGISSQTHWCHAKQGLLFVAINALKDLKVLKYTEVLKYLSNQVVDMW